MIDFSGMDDPTFLAERHRLHDALSDATGDAEQLADEYAAYEAEFLRRANLTVWKVCT